MESRVEIERKVLSRNDELAAELRRRWREQGVFCVNLVSSPGSGKTTLLERTLRRLQGRLRAAVLVGDVQTENDARRLVPYGFPVRQIVTGGTCHLDATMVDRHLDGIAAPDLELLIIENVGNLVCPSSYDLGEDAKVVLLSSVEGDDKPQKYPGMFRRSRVLIITKTDLLGLTEFEPDRAATHARALNPDLKVFKTSCKTGEGLDEWCEWLEAGVRAKRAEAGRLD